MDKIIPWAFLLLSIFSQALSLPLSAKDAQSTAFPEPSLYPITNLEQTTPGGTPLRLFTAAETDTRVPERPLPPSRPLHSGRLPDEPLPTGVRQFTTGAGERPFPDVALPEQPSFNGPLPERPFLNRALPEGLPNAPLPDEPFFNRPVPFSNGPLFEGTFFNGQLFEGPLSNGPLPYVAPSTNPAREDHTTPQRFSITHTVSLIPLPPSAVVHQSSQT
jgi:hypothetical protein